MCCAGQQSTRGLVAKRFSDTVLLPAASWHVEGRAKASGFQVGESLGGLMRPGAGRSGSQLASARLTPALSAGAYGLPLLRTSPGYKLYDDTDAGFCFEHPRGWVTRRNTQRAGVYIADFQARPPARPAPACRRLHAPHHFAACVSHATRLCALPAPQTPGGARAGQTSDKAVLEIFPGAGLRDEELVSEVVARVVAPGQDVGGDARLIMPDQRRVKSEAGEIAGQRYMYITFPSETITRSGYQIRRRNFAVAAARHGRLFCLVASARGDQFSPDKEATLRHIVDSFRLLA